LAATGISEMIPDKRASRSASGYLHEGESIVTFQPPLTVDEWEQLMEYQKIALKIKPEKKDGKEGKPKKPEGSEED